MPPMFTMLYLGAMNTCLHTLNDVISSFNPFPYHMGNQLSKYFKQKTFNSCPTDTAIIFLQGSIHVRRETSCLMTHDFSNYCYHKNHFCIIFL